MKYLGLLILSLMCIAAAPATAPTGQTMWVQADALGNGWGLYPINGDYGGTKPLGPFVAHGTGQLTWVADFPQAAMYQVWVRRYGGYGKVAVTIDERPVTGGRGGAGGGRYVWQHLGSAEVTAGAHHVDIDIDNCMFDAVLLTRDEKLDPAGAELPKPLADPVIRAPRRYRDDSSLAKAAGDAGVVVGRVHPYSLNLNDWLPEAEDVVHTLTFRSAANQYAPVDFAVRALKATGDLPLSVSELKGPEEATIQRDQIDLRVVELRQRTVMLFRGHHPKALVPDFLVRDDRHGETLSGEQGGFGGGECMTSIPAHESRQFHLVVHVPAKTPPGTYRGTVLIGQPERPVDRLAVELTVLPLELKPVEGYYSSFYRAQPVNKDRPYYVAPASYLAALKDQVRHGLNAVTLYGGFDSLEYVVKAGMTEAPCIMNWPPGDAKAQIDKAKSLGLPGLLYYGVDEPRKPEQIERARKEGVRRQKLGLPMMMAVNDRKAQKELEGLVSNPIYNLKVFYGRDNPAVVAARKAGHTPISYWGTQSSYPLYVRAFIGLYNTASGYGGSAPWDYYDVPYPDSDYGVVRFDTSGEPVPSLRWEAWRDGIDDVRYLQALDRAIAAAQKEAGQGNASAALGAALEKARGVRKKYFDSIQGAWHRYLLALKVEDLEAGRQAMAEATIGLLAQVKEQP